MNRNDFTLEKINTDGIDESRFNNAIFTVSNLAKGEKGIGTLSEKSVHSVLKHYYAPNTNFHEVKIVGNYVADACVEGEIYEIQSKSFYTMKDKLTAFLKDYDVTIIYPVAVKKYLRYIDPDTGEISKPKLSSKRGNIFDILSELYSIKYLLDNKRLHFVICFIEMEEYKLLDGRGKNKTIKATKTDRVPTKIIGEFYINRKKDFLNFLPGFADGKKQKDCPLPVEFTTKDIADSTGFHISYAQYLTNILCHLKLINLTGKKGRLNTYKIKTGR